MQKVKLGDVCEILDNQRVPITASERKSGPYPYYGANGLQDYVDGYIFDDDLVLLAEDGGNFGSKDKPIAYRVSGKCWVNNHAHVLKPKDNIDVNYLCYSLMFYNVDGLVNGATRQKLTQKDMRKISIPLPLIEEQKAIAEQLDKVSILIEKRKQQLSLLDTLVKSKFVEMFGEGNQSNFELVPLYKVSKKIFAGGDKPKKTVAVKDNIFQYPVYANGYENKGLQGYSCEYKVDEYAITISARGTIGYCFIRAPYFTPAVRLITIVPNKECNIIYLKCALQNLDLKASGTSQAQLTVPLFRQERIAVPPICLQNKFANFVKQTEKLKEKIKQSLAALELLKKSLMQKYFG